MNNASSTFRRNESFGQGPFSSRAPLADQTDLTGLSTVQDELAYSAKLMRVAVPEMARHGSALNPMNYAVWYAHASGAIPGLSRDLGVYLEEQERLTPEQVRSLFNQYVNDQDVEAIERARDDLAEVFDTVARSTDASRAHTEAFEESLDAYIARLQEPQSADEMSQALAALIDDTATMRGNVGELGQQLANTVSEVRRLREELEAAREESLLDPLTGIANRRGFDLALRKALENEPGRSDRGCCLLLFDIDFFKRINDTYGHPLGDRVIAAVGKILAKAVTAGQTAARYGGEEFAIILPEASRGEARALAERLRAEVARGRIKRRDGEQIAQVTVSAGVCVPPVERDAETYLSTADEALYLSKNNGRNQVSILPASADVSGRHTG